MFSGLLHIALMTIVIGACVTHFWGVQGEIHLRADKAETLTINPSALTESKSLSLFLWDFQIVYAEDGQTTYIHRHSQNLEQDGRHCQSRL